VSSRLAIAADRYSSYIPRPLLHELLHVSRSVSRARDDVAPIINRPGEAKRDRRRAIGNSPLRLIPHCRESGSQGQTGPGYRVLREDKERERERRKKWWGEGRKSDGGIPGRRNPQTLGMITDSPSPVPRPFALLFLRAAQPSDRGIYSLSSNPSVSRAIYPRVPKRPERINPGQPGDSGPIRCG